MTRPRITEELELLRRYYSEVDHAELGGEDWFRISEYDFPDGWQIGLERFERGPIVFKTGVSYPIGEPYGFATRSGINFRGTPPGNTGSPVSPPFEGEWQHFSWAPKGWHPTDTVREGANLFVWVRSFAQRLAEGA